MSVPTLSSAQALRLLAQATMRPFTSSDWSSFAGCMYDEPMIGEVESWVLVLDGPWINVLHESDDTGGQMFMLAEL